MDNSGKKLRLGEAVRVFLWEQKGDDKIPSEVLLMEALQIYCGGRAVSFEPDNVKIERGLHGKPNVCKKEGGRWVLRDDLFFSISHTNRWWACAVYSRPIGADIEERGRRVKEAVAERFFTKEEQQWLLKKGNMQDHILELWVRKEAYVKYLGTGLSEGLWSFSAVRDGMLSGEVGEGDKSTFCGALFPEGYPIPLTGAFCTRYEPKGIEIGFLERSGEPWE